MDFTTEHTYKTGRFLRGITDRRTRLKVVIGEDMRRPSDMFECALLAGLAAITAFYSRTSAPTSQSTS